MKKKQKKSNDSMSVIEQDQYLHRYRLLVRKGLLQKLESLRELYPDYTIELDEKAVKLVFHEKAVLAEKKARPKAKC